MAIIKLAVVAGALSEDPRQAVQLARRAGFGGMQIDASWAPLQVTAMSDSARREWMRLLAASGLECVGLSCDFGSKGLGPGADVDRILARMDAILLAAAELAAPLVCVDLGALPGSPGQADSALAELGRRADRYGVTMAFRSDLASFANLEQTLKRVNCPWFGVDLDPVAMLHDQWDMGEIFSRLGPLVRHVRGRDANVGAERRTRSAPIGRGDAPWPAIRAALDESGYAGWITVDPMELADRTAAALAGREYLANS